MGQDWPIISLLREWWPIFFILFFETVLCREHSEKVLKKFIGNFYFWGITLTVSRSTTCQKTVWSKNWNSNLSFPIKIIQAKTSLIFKLSERKKRNLKPENRHQARSCINYENQNIQPHVKNNSHAESGFGKWNLNVKCRYRSKLTNVESKKS